jgi:DNA-binding CsgD family transcriptional regulator
VKLLARGRTGGLDDALERLGWAALMRGDHERAWALHTESLELSRRSGDRWNTAENVEGLACAAAAAAEAERAARLFGAAEALREVLGYERKPEERTFREARVSAARTRLGQTAWDEAFAEGKTMEFEEVVEYVLSQEEPSTTASSATPGKSSSSASEHPYGLTSREAEVLRLVAAGMTSSQVAKELFLSPRTVSTHLTSIYRKIGVSSRAAAIRFALETGLA